ncbi:hypothetical protein D6783_00350 [Candidatus Woesearchaeota archaeon]|nr:MAG: hypothetical protein D6783_00350 [Candidatus Woesearchaeota archaeon]
MKDAVLLFFGAGIAVAGLVVLSVLPPVQTEGVVRAEPQDKVVFSGVVVRLGQSKGVSWLRVRSCEDVPVVVFGGGSGNASIAPGDMLRIEGEVGFFQGERQVVADAIVLVNASLAGQDEHVTE